MERLTCNKCGKFLRCEAVGTVVARFICPNNKCKHVNDVRKVILDDTHNLKVKFPEVDDPNN